MAHDRAHIGLIHRLKHDDHSPPFLVEDPLSSRFRRQTELVAEVLEGFAFMLRMTRRRGEEDVLGCDTTNTALSPLLVKGIVLYDGSEDSAAGGVGILVGGHINASGRYW